MECRRLDWFACAEGPSPDSSIHACSEQELFIRVDGNSLKRVISHLLGTYQVEAYELAIVRVHVACKCD